MIDELDLREMSVNEFVFVPAHPPLAFKNAKPNFHIYTHTQNAPHATYAKRR